MSLCLLALASAACAKEPQPSSAEIEQALTASLPAFARVSSFSVEAIQNMGTQVEPVWQSRFKATVKVTAATFIADGSEQGIVFVRAVRQAGDSVDMFGKSVSTLFAGQWRTRLSFEGQPVQALGQPESAFGSQKMLVRGSKDEATYLAQQYERRRQERLTAEKEAEAARQRAIAEMERQRAVEAQSYGILRFGTSGCTTDLYLQGSWSDYPLGGEVDFVDVRTGRVVLTDFPGKRGGSMLSGGYYRVCQSAGSAATGVEIKR